MRRFLFGLVVFCALRSAAFGQQGAAVSPTAKPAFAIADVHDSPRVMVPFWNGGSLRGDRYSLRQATLPEMIALAYGLKAEMVQGGPTWLDMRRFDVVAKIDSKTTEADTKVMLQSLLVDRFALAMHKGQVPMPAYVLTAPGGKTKMTRSADGAEDTCKSDPAPPTSTGVPVDGASCTGMSVDEIVKIISQVGATTLPEPVLNATGLEGTYDFKLHWTDFRRRAQAGAEYLPITDAVEKELGLKLTLQTAPRTVWIVDSVREEPTPNLPAVATELPAPPPAEFEVATVKPSPPDAQQNANFSNGQVKMVGQPMRTLLTSAWNLSNLDKQMIVNAPAWIDSDRFDIIGRYAVPDSVPGRTAPGFEDVQQYRQLMQSLLKERFGLKAHMEERPIEAYKMVADHPKLKVADSKSRTHCKEGPGADGKDPRVGNPMLTAIWSCYNISMKELGEELAHYATGYIYTPVLDATGLTGRYDLTMAWSSASLTVLAPLPPAPAPGQSAPEASAPNGAVTLYEAMDRQLGIRMVKEKRPVPVLVIEHIERTPTPN